MATALTTLSRFLAENLIALRKGQQLSQAALAKRAGIPRTTVTLMESGAANPSVATLVALAAALNVRLEELLAAPRPACQLLRANEIASNKRSTQGVNVRALLPDPLPHLELGSMELAAGASFKGTPHLAGTREYLTCTRGELGVRVENKEFVLHEGDVLAFPGERRHIYFNAGGRACKGISVVAFVPPA